MFTVDHFHSMLALMPGVIVKIKTPAAPAAAYAERLLQAGSASMSTTRLAPTAALWLPAVPLDLQRMPTAGR